MFGLDRSGRERPHLEWRVRLFAVAAVVGLAGIYLDDRWLTGAAILILLAGLSLRLARAPERESGSTLGDAPDE